MRPASRSGIWCRASPGRTPPWKGRCRVRGRHRLCLPAGGHAAESPRPQQTATLSPEPPDSLNVSLLINLGRVCRAAVCG